MDEKWDVFLTDDVLHLHRSGERGCVYQVRFRPAADGYEVAAALISMDGLDPGDSDLAFDTALLAYLIDTLLLGKYVPFPE